MSWPQIIRFRPELLSAFDRDSNAFPSPRSLDRRLGEYTLPGGWAIVAAGNRDSDRAATTRMPTPLRNRFVHIDFEVDVQEWSEWAIKANVGPEVIAFIRFRPELLSAFDRVMRG